MRSFWSRPLRDLGQGRRRWWGSVGAAAIAPLFAGALALVPLGAAGVGCSAPPSGEDVPEYTNPFTDPQEGGKEDTGYYNLRGVELHVTLEADVEADAWKMFDAPALLAEYAVTYLRDHDDFYLELMAEDTATPDRVEWLVDGTWLTKEEAEQVDKSKLKRFRLQHVNAVVLDRDAQTIDPGKVFEAPVPLSPYSVMQDAGDSCAKSSSHISLSQSIYWYLWSPNKSGCSVDKSTMSVTVEEVLPQGFDTYPEYDRLWEDDTLTVAVFWGKLDDGDVADDVNWENVDKFAQWLTGGGFTEVTDPAPALGRHFEKTSGDKQIEVDVYGPDVFHSVADWSRLDNWQAAVSTHEVVLYNGHSVLGSGMAFEQVTYPGFYQIFQVASCLSYEYYVRPILAGKGGWEDVDVISNVEPTHYYENLPLVGAMLSKLIWGFEHEGQASWKDIMEAVSRKLHHSRFGVSGARDNCFSPEGSLCEPPPPTCGEISDETTCTSTQGCEWVECPAGQSCGGSYICQVVGADPTEVRYESTAPVTIPDNDEAGVTSSLTISDPATIVSLKVELDVTHTYTGDLEIVLSHGGVDHTLWAREGGSSDDIDASFDVTDWDGQSLEGAWTLKIVDHARYDEGTLNRWALVATSVAP